MTDEKRDPHISLCGKYRAGMLAEFKYDGSELVLQNPHDPDAHQKQAKRKNASKLRRDMKRIRRRKSGQNN